MRSLTIRGGRLAVPDPASPEGIRLAEGDLQIQDGVITAVGRVPGDLGETFDARGLLVLPGLIDPQVHFREPGLTHKEDLASGSLAAAAGGITAYLEMPNTNPPTTTRDALDWKLSRAAETSAVHYGFYIGATPENLDVLKSLEGTGEVPGIKIFMGSSTGTLLVSEIEDLERIFANGALPIAVHAEDEARLRARAPQFAGRKDPAAHSELRDAETARLATEKALALSERYNRRLHILHMSTADEVELLERQGKGGGRVTCEVTPQHLLLEAPGIYDRLGTKAQMNPPLRDSHHTRTLWRALNTGLVDCIATDHAPHALEEKARGFGGAPSGMPGVETSAAAMFDAAQRGLTSIERVVALMSEGPARCWRILDKGRLAPGYDGDVTLVDLGCTARIEDRKIRSKAAWNPFEGVPLRGWPVATIIRGDFVYRDGESSDTARGTRLRFGHYRAPRAA